MIPDVRQFLWDCFGAACFAVVVGVMLALCSVACRGDEPVPVPDPISTPSIRLPMLPVNVEPNPQPRPIDPTEPRAVDTIRADEWYVVESSVELIALQSPGGFVTIDSDAGPITLRGKFADGSGKIEKRKYSSPYVYSVSGVKAGKFELVLVPIGVTLETAIVRQVLTVADGTKPNPPPDPGPGPKPEPAPDPVAPTKIQFVIIEDPTLRATLPPEQIAIMDGGEVREYSKTHCTITDGTPDKRVLSLRQDVSGQPAWIREAFAEPRTSVPWLVIVTPTKRISGALPATVAETLTLLKTYGGE